MKSIDNTQQSRGGKKLKMHFFKTIIERCKAMLKKAGNKIFLHLSTFFMSLAEFEVHIFLNHVAEYLNLHSKIRR